jgi:hypothetical protein
MQWPGVTLSCEIEVLVDAPGVEYPTGACGRNGVRIHGVVVPC